MPAHQMAIAGDRTLLLGSFDELPVDSLRRPFVTLVSAFDEAERRRVEAGLGFLLDLGCVEFCCVGPEAERLHDSLDGIIEDRQAIEVVTTWHTDSSDACEYFLFAAGGGSSNLLALVDRHPELVAELEKEARGT